MHGNFVSTPTTTVLWAALQHSDRSSGVAALTAQAALWAKASVAAGFTMSTGAQKV